ncbi:hypothetical protein ACFYNN_07445 [Streptomyces sp. NPDC006978]|uniref:hypothetical protein n=1 Tax=unclassified Streptomyces TaxID=2593676 RepID=UPI003681B071
MIRRRRSRRWPWSQTATGLIAGHRWKSARRLSAGAAGGLVFSALTNTCGRAKCLTKLPRDQPKATDLADTLASLTG